MKYLSVDIETTGLDPEKNGIIELGCVLADTEIPGWSVYFHRLIDPGQKEWTDYCTVLHKNWWPKEKHNAISAVDALWGLGEFLKIHRLDPLNIHAAGKNFASFDLQFLKHVPGYGQVVKFKHRSLDPSILFFDPMRDKEIPDTKECCRRAGIPTGGHRALDDAKMVVGLLNIGFGRRVS